MNKNRDSLKPNEHVIETLTPLSAIARDVLNKLRRYILGHIGYTCQVCESAA